MTQDFLAQEEEKSVIERQRQRKKADRLEKKRNTSLASIICNEIAWMDLQVGLLHEFPTSTWGQTSTAALATLTEVRQRTCWNVLTVQCHVILLYMQFESHMNKQKLSLQSLQQSVAQCFFLHRTADNYVRPNSIFQSLRLHKTSQQISRGLTCDS